MAQVILIEENKVLNDLISVNLTTYLGVDLIQRKNSADTISLLAILPTIDIIITTKETINEATAEILSGYIKENHLAVNLIILGADSGDNDFTITIANPKDWEQVIHSTAKILGISDDVLKKKAIPDYIPIPVQYFLNLELVNCNVFIRIKSTPTEYQFIKRIHNGDSITKDSIKRYIAQGLSHFYISKADQKNFAIFLSNRLVEKIDSTDTDDTERIQIMGESFAIVIEEIHNLGFNSETIQLADSIISNMVKNFDKFPEMSGLLHKVINSETGYLYQRSHMTSVVACEMVKNLKIKNERAYEIVAYAAFFQDIKLAEREEFAKINSLEDLQARKLNEEDWDLVLNHANRAALLVERHAAEAPEGVNDLIRHHHGVKNGIGFGKAITDLPDLSKIFIIANQFVFELLQYKEKGGEPKSITDELFKRFPGMEIAIIIKSLEKTLKKVKPK